MTSPKVVPAARPLAWPFKLALGCAVALALAATAPGPVRERLAALARDLSVPVTAGSVLIFGGRQFVLARLAGPSVHLLDLQRRVVGALDDPVDRHGTFTAGAWTPPRVR